MRNVLFFLSVIIALGVSGCASLKEPEQVQPIQQNLLTKCPPLSKHEGTTGKAVLDTLLHWASEYNDCATRHNGLVDTVSRTEGGKPDGKVETK
jgi:hypothetical protein